MHVGEDGTNAPLYTSGNESNNKFFFFPLILAVIGMCFHFYKAPKDAFVVLLTFIFTGLAIVIFLNQKPFEPRERDYAYAGSFYAFSMWIGLSVYALYEFSKGISKELYKKIGIIALGGLVFFGLIDMGDEAHTAKLSWIYIAIIALLIAFIANVLGKKSKNEVQGAVVAILLTIGAPLIMAVQGWDDHDRSDKTSARDLAYNYLESCGKNAILFTNGDNDTFPLWYLQEVEEKRTDVRVCNLSLMQTDWYTDQMKMKAYDSDPLPIKFREDQILMYAGNTDQVYFLSMLDMMNMGISKETLSKIYSTKIKYNKAAFEQAFQQFQANNAAVVNGVQVKDPALQARVDEIKKIFSTPVAKPSYQNVEEMMGSALELLMAYSNGMLQAPQEQMQQFNEGLKAWETGWDYLPIDVAMEFVRDDNNLLNNQGNVLRVFPSKGFIVPVNKQNVVASGIVSKADAQYLPNEIRFTMDKQAITREQVMMLDVIANNDWKRPIYFSSPGGSDVSIALYSNGFVKQNGIAYEFTPLRNNDPIDKEKMLANLTKVYNFGLMNKKGVLSDYYTRRHTSQYRDHFSRLADAFLREAEELSTNKSIYPAQISVLRQTGNKKSADSLQAILDGADKKIVSNKKFAIKLINRSLEVMPIANVIDYGEPTPSRETYEVGPGLSYSAYTDGTLHDYVGVLFRAGDKKRAEQVASEVATQIESILNYFEFSAARFALGNKEDFISALNNYMVLATFAADPEVGNANSVVSKRIKTRISKIYKVVVPRICSELRNEGYPNAEVSELKAHLEAVAIKFGYLARPQIATPQGAPQGSQQLTTEQIQEMMQMQAQ